MDSPLTLHTLRSGAPTDLDELDRRILRAALAQFARVGLRRASADDIARHAQINRKTLHRRIGPKSELIRAALSYECRRVLAHIAAQLDPAQPLGERAAHSFALTVATLRAHPLLRQVLAVEPDDTLVWLTRDGADLLAIATTFIADQINQARLTDAGISAGTTSDTTAAVIVRLVHSLVLTPDGPPDLTTYPALLAFARTYVTPLVAPPPRRNQEEAPVRDDPTPRR